MPRALSRRPRDGVVRTVGDEVRRYFRSPYLDLATVVVNAVTATLLWVFIPVGWREWVFDAFPGRIAFPLALGTWMLSDTTSTNLLGNDERSAVAALRGEVPLQHVLRIKALTLGGAIGLAMAAITLIQSRHSGWTWAFIPSAMTMPIGIVALAGVLGVVAPYRVRPIAWRWARRDRRWTMLRWITLVVIPYGGVGTLVTAHLVLARWVSRFATPLDHAGHLGPQGRIYMAAATVGSSLLCFVLAPLLADAWARRHRDRLLAYLTDPEAG